MATLKSLKNEIKAIQERNTRVEENKAWETSLFRKTLIIIITYTLAVVVMLVIGIKEPYFNALIPTLGFYLSTLTLNLGKRFWIRHFYKRPNSP